MSDKMNLSAIGSVNTAGNGFAINLYKKYASGLTELNNFSHALVLWWCSFFDDPEYRKIYVAEKPYVKGPDSVGIFSTRSPMRPNPIALSAVFIERIDIEKGIIYTPYIDAENGTPVLDIKPYMPSDDRIKNIKVPEWCSHWPKWYEDSAGFDWQAEFNFQS